MSWMDSWSRPSKHAVTPPPLYLTVGEDVPYCHTCGRIIGLWDPCQHPSACYQFHHGHILSHSLGSRKATAHAKEVKYCSTRCKNNKPGPIDRKIEATFVALLNGAHPEDLASDADEVREQSRPKQQHTAKGKKKVKGDPRIVVECSEVETLVFNHPKDPEKVHGRKKNRAARGVIEKEEEWRSVDMVNDPEPPKPSQSAETTAEQDIGPSDASTIEEDHMAGGVPLDTVDEYGYGGGKIRPPQGKSDVNGSVGGEKGWAERIEETEDMQAKRREGQRRAEEKEMVKRAARRLCAFGVLVPQHDMTEEGTRKKGTKEGGREAERRKCEAVMKGAAVEPSYAKGEWGIRWREKV